MTNTIEVGKSIEHIKTNVTIPDFYLVIIGINEDGEIKTNTNMTMTELYNMLRVMLNTIEQQIELDDPQRPN